MIVPKENKIVPVGIFTKNELLIMILIHMFDIGDNVYFSSISYVLDSDKYELYRIFKQYCFGGNSPTYKQVFNSYYDVCSHNYHFDFLKSSTTTIK